MMKVTLLSYTPDPEITVALAARTCYSSKLPLAISKERAEYLIRELIERGHESVLEHASFTFAIEGISRVTSHQLVRHRLASYSQQSQRYVSVKEADFIIPPSVVENSEAQELFYKAIEESKKAYQELVNLGIPQEDARYMMAQGIATNLVLSANARELLHIFRLRLCNRAQWEIRELAQKMLELVKDLAPAIFEWAGPPCVEGECQEGENSCGKPWKKREK